MKADRAAICDLLAEYGALIEMAKFGEWLDLFAEECRYQIVPHENFDRGLPAGLVFCDSRAMLEDRIRALREANKYNIHTDRHVIGLPRIFEDGLTVEAAFAVYQTDQEGETRLFAERVAEEIADLVTQKVADVLQPMEAKASTLLRAMEEPVATYRRVAQHPVVRHPLWTIIIFACFQGLLSAVLVVLFMKIV